MEWFRNYKVPTGKPPNGFAFDADFKGRLLALEIVEEVHSAWKELIEQRAAAGSTKLCVLGVLLVEMWLEYRLV